MVGGIVFIASILLSFTTGIVVLIKNPRQKSNIIYAFTTLSYILLSTANYLSLYSSGNTKLLLIRLVMVFSCVSVALTYYLILSILEQRGKKFRRIIYWAGILLTIGIALASFTPLIIFGLTSDGGTERIVTGSLIGLYLIQMGLFIFGIARLLIRNIFTNESIGQQRVQFIYMLIGLLPVFLLAPITSIYLPLVQNDFSLIFLTPIYSTLFVTMVGYAILKHKLFDIRPIIARLFGYFVSILIIAVLFIGLSLGLGVLLVENSVSTGAILLFALISLITVLIFQPIKNYFDKITVNFFYRDAYVAKDIINNVNSAIVGTKDIYELASKVVDIIKKNMKLSTCYIYMESGIAGSGQYFGIDDDMDKQRNELIALSSALRHSHNAIFYREANKIDNRVRAHIEALNAQAIVKLLSNDKEVGYLVVGYKKSGDILSKDDLQVVKIIADEIAIAVQNVMSFEEISRFNATLQKNIDDATSQLRRSNEKLKALDEAKDDFVSMASHQLRTPLTSVKGYLSMVLEGDAGELKNAQQRMMLEQAFTSSQRMTYLIADLLNLSRLKTGKFVIESSPTNLAPLITEELAQVKATADARSVTITYNEPAEYPTLNLDETKIRQVIMNFVDNAIYYTPNGGDITVALSNNPKTIECTVKDNGIGIPKNEQHNLFSKFYRASNAKKVRPDGTGLGLFMARKVIVAQGGAIIFHSEEGKGSTFGFSFPKNDTLLAVHKEDQKLDEHS